MKTSDIIPVLTAFPASAVEAVEALTVVFEVAFIVLTFGTAQGNIPLVALGALLALGVVALVGVLLREPLSRVPENTLKFAVGLVLSAFGLFWSVEALAVEWPGRDLAILGLLVYLTILSLGFVAILRNTSLQLAAGGRAQHRREIEP